MRKFLIKHRLKLLVVLSIGIALLIIGIAEIVGSLGGIPIPLYFTLTLGSAIGALLAAMAAANSVELATSTTRPFLRINSIKLETHELFGIILDIRITNSGNLPANGVSIHVKILRDEESGDSKGPWIPLRMAHTVSQLGQEEEGKELLFELKSISALYFPGDEVGAQWRVGAPLLNLMRNTFIRFNVRVDYRNKYSARKPLYTVREYKCTSVEVITGSTFEPIANKDDCD